MAEISLTDNQDTSFKPLSIRRFWNESTVATGESTLGEECAHISLRPGGPRPRATQGPLNSDRASPNITLTFQTFQKF